VTLPGLASRAAMDASFGDVLSAILDAVGEGIVVVDRDGRA